jgi:hypothetical protein
MIVPRNEISLLRSKTLGKHSVLLEPEPPQVATHHIIKLEETIRKTNRTWFGMCVSKSRRMYESRRRKHLPVQRTVSAGSADRASLSYMASVSSQAQNIYLCHVHVRRRRYIRLAGSTESLSRAGLDCRSSTPTVICSHRPSHCNFDDHKSSHFFPFFFAYGLRATMPVYTSGDMVASHTKMIHAEP